MTQNALQQRLVEAIAREQAATARLEQVRTLQTGASADDEHDPDGVPLSFEWSKAQALLQVARSERARLEQAIQRAQQRTYGICERCGSTIDPRRLDARPDALLCIGCARLVEPHCH